MYQHIEQYSPGEIEKFQGKINELAGQFGYERNIINPQERASGRRLKVLPRTL